MAAEFGYTVNEVVAITGIPRPTVYYHLQTGLLPSTRVGRRSYRVSADCIRAYMTWDASRQLPEPKSSLNAPARQGASEAGPAPHGDGVGPAT